MFTLSGIIKGKIEVGPGDIIPFTPGEKYWHGGQLDSEFTHVFVATPDSKTTMLEE
jgi:quercetin dioxygenase-like cupin family protein